MPAFISSGVDPAICSPMVNFDRYSTRYFFVLDCFMPSEADGMPHALMGMWKLFTVK